MAPIFTHFSSNKMSPIEFSCLKKWMRNNLDPTKSGAWESLEKSKRSIKNFALKKTNVYNNCFKLLSVATNYLWSYKSNKVVDWIFLNQPGSQKLDDSFEEIGMIAHPDTKFSQKLQHCIIQTNVRLLLSQGKDSFKQQWGHLILIPMNELCHCVEDKDGRFLALPRCLKKEDKIQTSRSWE